MPRLLGLQLSSGALALRVVLGAIAALVTFVVFYYVPANLPGFASALLGSGSSTAGETVSGFLKSLINPNLPTVGLLLTVFVFIGVVIRGTRAYGAVVIVDGLLFAVYVYLAFQGGTISISLPSGLPSSAAGTVAIGASTLMYIFLIAPLLTMVKGSLILALPGRQAAPPAQPPAQPQ